MSLRQKGHHHRPRVGALLAGDEGLPVQHAGRRSADIEQRVPGPSTRPSLPMACPGNGASSTMANCWPSPAARSACCTTCAAAQRHPPPPTPHPQPARRARQPGARPAPDQEPAVWRSGAGAGHRAGRRLCRLVRRQGLRRGCLAQEARPRGLPARPGAKGIAARDALAIEDSPGSVAAACAAGVPVLVTRSIYFARAEMAGAIAISPGLGQRRGWQPALADAATAGRVTLDDLAAPGGSGSTSPRPPLDA